MTWTAAAIIGGAQVVSGMMQGQAASEAAGTSAAAQLQAAQIAAEAARFRPIGMSNRFGSSYFNYAGQGAPTQTGVGGGMLGGQIPVQSTTTSYTLPTNIPKRPTLQDFEGGRGSLMVAQKTWDAQYGSQALANQIAQQQQLQQPTLPVGVKAGDLQSAGYTLSPEMLAQQNKLMGVSEQALGQYQGAYDATRPMGQAAQTMMGLGNQYLSTSPQEQAQKYMAEQQALLAGGRAADYAALQNRLQAQGRSGLSIGGGGGMMSANPELQAYYNAQRQQDLGLAAQATQGGMDYAKFGSGMVGSGGDMLKGMYGVQTAAYDPYQTAMGGVQTAEGIGRGAFDLSTSLGAKQSTAGANMGQSLLQGGLSAAKTAQSGAWSPFGTMLSGAANAFGNYQMRQQPQMQMNYGALSGGQPSYGLPVTYNAAGNEVWRI